MHSPTIINTNYFKTMIVLRSICPLEFVSLIPLENKLYADRDLESSIIIQTSRFKVSQEHQRNSISLC